MAEEKTAAESTEDARGTTRNPDGGEKPSVPGAGGETTAERMHDPRPELKEDNSKATKLRGAFLKLSGYKASDIVGENASTRTFVTGNGGKYVLSPKGTKLRILSGPNTPAMLEAEAEEEEEEE